ncbi:hypothetical protein [Enterococcus sp.]|jgi:hypothetical protein|uniref:hypothetical protein n=1 Tax=Enterococcus sp. TaxID=35783 RepID=UPI0025C3F433|nr:hypothetical protein [Enterococcus sp.]
MPFIVYFFISLLAIYIPLPTLLLLCQRLAVQHDTITMVNKFILLLMILLDYFVTYYLLKKCKVKTVHYVLLVGLNLLEFAVHGYLYWRFEAAPLMVIMLFQLVLLLCMFSFPFSKKFRRYLFD